MTAIKKTEQDLHQNTEKKRKPIVFLVEDDETIRSLISSYLQIVGYHLIMAENGVNALDIIQNQPQEFDILIADLIMPKMGGRELALELLKKYPLLKIILISGYIQNEKTLAGLPPKTTRFIRKPFLTEVIDETIQELWFQSSPNKNA